MTSDITMKGLSDLRTSLRARVHSMPRQKGSAHRDLYLLSKEKDRLEKELTRLDRQQKRVDVHLREILEIIGKLGRDTRAEAPHHQAFVPAPEGESTLTRSIQRGNAQWKTMSLDY